MVNVEITGTDFAKVAAVLRRTDPELQKELTNRVGKVAEKVRDDMRTAVMGVSSEAHMDGSARNFYTAGKGGRGGQKARMAHQYKNRTANLAEAATTGKRLWTRTTLRNAKTKTGLRTSVAASLRIDKRATGVRLSAGSAKLPKGQQKLPKYMNKGQWRHPYFGHKKGSWVVQTVHPAGWFDTTARRNLPYVEAQVTLIVREYAEKEIRLLRLAA